MKELIKWISITDRFTKMYLNDKFEELGINSSQHMFILRICENEGITQDELYPTIYINKSNITRALTQLEKNGFITRVPKDSDKRSLRLYPTAKAKDAYNEIKIILNDWLDILETGIGDDDKKLFEELIEKIGRNSMDSINKNKK